MISGPLIFLPPHLAISTMPAMPEASKQIGPDDPRPGEPNPRDLSSQKLTRHSVVVAQLGFSEWIRNDSSQILIRIKHVGIQNSSISPILLVPYDFENKRKLYGPNLKNDLSYSLVSPLDQEVRIKWLKQLIIAKGTTYDEVSGAYGECQVKLRSPTRTWDDIFPKFVIVKLLDYLIETAPAADSKTIINVKAFRAQINR